MDTFKYLGLQVTADWGCEIDVVHRMIEGCRAWGAPKSVPSNRGLWIKPKKYLKYLKPKKFLKWIKPKKYEGVIVPTHCTEQRHGV